MAESMELRVASKAHVLEIMGWFPDRAACADWGGPMFRFPYTVSTFFEDIRWPDVSSFSLVGDGGELLGFGQYYLREGRCQLARLVISPAQRRRGLGRVLTAELARLGTRDLGVDECSLFVMEHNEPAARCYRGLGFEPAHYPAEMTPLEGCVFMVRAVPSR